MLLQGPALAQSTLDTLTFEKKEKLAKAGDDEAQFAIARAYEEGREGQRKDVLKAAQWYRKAAQLGNLDAQFRLAQIVHNGADGVKKSPDGGEALRSSGRGRSPRIGILDGLSL